MLTSCNMAAASFLLALTSDLRGGFLNQTKLTSLEVIPHSHSLKYVTVPRKGTRVLFLTTTQALPCAIFCCQFFCINQCLIWKVVNNNYTLGWHSCRYVASFPVLPTPFFSSAARQRLGWEGLGTRLAEVLKLHTPSLSSVARGILTVMALSSLT